MTAHGRSTLTVILVMAAALARLGVDAPVLAELSSAPLLGGGEPVGDVRFAGW